ncbi:hypothetical protein evm_012245 [Chilo suppressalis]|nr:hypothetical protein evm_012245 [Chilo suppressalis]
MEQNENLDKERNRKPRKIMKVNPSRYEVAEAMNANRRYWKSVFNEIEANTAEAIEESKQIAKVLPNNLYEKVCTTLNMPMAYSIQDDESIKLKGKLTRRLVKEPMLSQRKCLHIDRELDSDTDVEFESSDDGDDEGGDEKLNIHMELLSKPEREQVTWPSHYLQPEKEEEKTLIRKADDLTDRIATEFCKYMKELGGNQQSQLFTPKAIKELFQIEFDTHVARGVSVVPKEIPCVEDRIAAMSGFLEKSKLATLEREITRDIIAERRPDKLVAFGKSLPCGEGWRAPRNDTNNSWRSARHVPRDLVTLKTVWEGITNLRSVKEYCRWMIEHPEYRRAPYLSSLGMFDPAVLEARLTFEAASPLASPDVAPAPIDHIRRRLSQLADTN